MGQREQNNARSWWRPKGELKRKSLLFRINAVCRFVILQVHYVMILLLIKSQVLYVAIDPLTVHPPSFYSAAKVHTLCVQ